MPMQDGRATHMLPEAGRRLCGAHLQAGQVTWDPRGFLVPTQDGRGCYVWIGELALDGMQTQGLGWDAGRGEKLHPDV